MFSRSFFLTIVKKESFFSHFWIILWFYKNLKVSHFGHRQFQFAAIQTKNCLLRFLRQNRRSEKFFLPHFFGKYEKMELSRKRYWFQNGNSYYFSFQMTWVLSMVVKWSLGLLLCLGFVPVALSEIIGRVCREHTFDQTCCLLSIQINNSWCHACMRKLWDIYLSLKLRYVLYVWNHYHY